MKLKTKYRFSIRKFSIGTGSVLLGAFLFVGFQDVAHADEIHNNTSLQLGDTTSKPQPLENEVTKSSNSEISTQTQQLTRLNLKTLLTLKKLILTLLAKT